MVIGQGYFGVQSGIWIPQTEPVCLNSISAGLHSGTASFRTKALIAIRMLGGIPTNQTVGTAEKILISCGRG